MNYNHLVIINVTIIYSKVFSKHNKNTLQLIGMLQWVGLTLNVGGPKPSSHTKVFIDINRMVYCGLNKLIILRIIFLNF